MLRIAVCDDNPDIIKAITQKVQEEFRLRRQIVAIESYLDPAVLCKEAGCQHFHVFFLDIDMPHLNGIELAGKLRQMPLSRDSVIVYISSFDDLVFQTFPIRPFGFIRKNHFEEEIPDIVKRILDAYEKERGDAIVFEEEGKTYALPGSQILYLESFNKVQVLHTKDREYRLTEKLGVLEEKLQPYGFLRIHKSYLVNYRFIESYGQNTVILSGGVQLPVSKYRMKETKDAYLQLIAGEI